MAPGVRRPSVKPGQTPTANNISETKSANASPAKGNNVNGLMTSPSLRPTFRALVAKAVQNQKAEVTDVKNSKVELSQTTVRL